MVPRGKAFLIILLSLKKVMNYTEDSKKLRTQSARSILAMSARNLSSEVWGTARTTCRCRKDWILDWKMWSASTAYLRRSDVEKWLAKSMEIRTLNGSASSVVQWQPGFATIASTSANHATSEEVFLRGFMTVVASTVLLAFRILHPILSRPWAVHSLLDAAFADPKISKNLTIEKSSKPYTIKTVQGHGISMR